MMSKIWRDLLILLAVFGGIVAGYVLLRQQFPESFGIDPQIEFKSDITREQEEKLGDFLMETFEESGALINDPEVDSMMAPIYRRLLHASMLTEDEVKFYILKEDDINAVTLPGGNIVIFTGLIEACETPEQLSAVIAHELGHVYHEHVLEKIVRELGISAVVSVLTGGDPTVVHELSQMAFSNYFSKQQESEADEFAIRVLINARIHPKAMTEFFEFLNDEDLSYAKELEWLMSHPHNDARIEASKSAKIPSNFSEKPYLLDWAEVKDAI